MNAPGKTLSALLYERILAKHAEDDAAGVRREIDAKIADALRNPAKAEGTVTQRVGELKVSVTYGLNRTVDNNELKKDWVSLPEKVQAAFYFSAKVAASPLKQLPDALAQLAAKYITAKPSSPSVTVEVSA